MLGLLEDGQQPPHALDAKEARLPARQDRRELGELLRLRLLCLLALARVLGLVVVVAARQPGRVLLAVLLLLVAVAAAAAARRLLLLRDGLVLLGLVLQRGEPRRRLLRRAHVQQLQQRQLLPRGKVGGGAGRRAWGSATDGLRLRPVRGASVRSGHACARTASETSEASYSCSIIAMSAAAACGVFSTSPRSHSSRWHASEARRSGRWRDERPYATIGGSFLPSASACAAGSSASGSCSRCFSYLHGGGGAGGEA